MPMNIRVFLYFGALLILCAQPIASFAVHGVVAPVYGVSSLRANTFFHSLRFSSEVRSPKCLVYKLVRTPLNLVASQSLDDVSAAKSELLSIISGTGMGSNESAESARKIDELVDKLSSQPSQFSRAAVDGEWALVFTRNSKGSPTLQKVTQSVERLGSSFANFDVSRGEFYNIAEVLGGAGTLSATVKFSEATENVSAPPMSFLAAKKHAHL